MSGMGSGMTTIAELFEQEPIETSKGVSLLFGNRYNHVEEINPLRLVDIIDKEGFASAIEICVFHKSVIDRAKMQIMFGVKFDEKWVMLCRNAGEDLSMFSDSQIVDAKTYLHMVDYIEDQIIENTDPSVVKTVGIDTDVEFIFAGFDVRLRYFDY